MRFIWVNDRMPSSHSVCAACDRSIGASYLRHIETRLYYCDPDCYASARPNDRGIDPLTQDQAGAIPESTLTLLHHSGDADAARAQD